jgi:flavin reductase (DIM6/NTAB) family NADH-FMN oxidoreductase RutF
MLQSIGARPLVFATPVWVIGTYDSSNRPNVMTASWGGICCSQPPCINVCLRKATYSFAGLVEHAAFTVNVPSEQLARETDFFGRASGRRTDKLAVAGLTAVRSEIVDAPYVAELPMVLECTLRHTLEIGLHTMFVGEILDIKAAPEVLDARGVPDPEKVRPFVYSPEARKYHGLGAYLGDGGALGRELMERST